MFWWHIVHVNKEDMLYRVYSAQKVSPVQGDWVKLLDSDKSLFNINMTDDDIESISSYKLKNYLKKTAQKLTLNYIESLQQKHSKSEKYETADLSTADYLTDGRFSKYERELLFKLRSRTIQVKNNFQNGNLENLFCDLCKLFTCTQEHVLSCPEITKKVRIVNTTQVEHSDIFGNVDQQLTYIKIYSQFWSERQSLLESEQ